MFAHMLSLLEKTVYKTPYLMEVIWSYLSEHLLLDGFFDPSAESGRLERVFNRADRLLVIWQREGGMMMT